MLQPVWKWIAAQLDAARGPAPAFQADVANTTPPPWMKVSADVLARSRRQSPDAVPLAFAMPQHPPGVIPGDVADADLLANDEQVIEVNAWAAQQVYNGAYVNGVTFLGYTYLSELAQRPEYRRVSEVLATEATRKWIKLGSQSADDQSKADKIAELTAEMVRLDVQGVFRKCIEVDGFFGRSHLYLDTGSTDDRDELTTSIGNGRNAVTLNKFSGRKGFLEALKVIEPVWCYPAKYNANDPLKPDWYNPQSWFCQGKEIHVSRLLCFVGREVPDLLKPSYSFGGLSLSQMVKPYVDNWLRTRQAVADLIWSFNVRVLKTNLTTLLAQDGDDLFKRAALFANLQTNQGLFLMDKDTEDFDSIATPLGTLDALQAQSQEHMASVSGTPVVKLLGIQPAGLNASSEGELTVWYDWVEAFQEKFITKKLSIVLDFIMLSLWGEIDSDITFTYESLRSLTEKEAAEKRLSEAQTDQILSEVGAIGPEDIRNRLIKDPESPYDGLGDEPLPDQDEGEIDDTDLLGGQSALGLGPREDRTERGGPRDDGADRGASREPRARTRPERVTERV